MNYGPYGFYQPNYFSPNGAMPDALNQHKAQFQPSFMQPQTQSNDMIWVQGEAGAKAYLVAPNSTVTLWDSENKTIYVKTADASGVPSMKILDFTVREENLGNKHTCTCSKDFVTKEEFGALETKFEGILEKIEAITKEEGKN